MPKIRIGAYQGYAVSENTNESDQAELTYADREAHRRFIVKLIGEEELRRIDEKAEAEYASR